MIECWFRRLIKINIKCFGSLMKVAREKESDFKNVTFISPIPTQFLQDLFFECFPHEYLNVKRTFIPFFDPFHWYDSAYLAMCIDIVNKSPIKNSFQIHIKCNSNVIFYNARIQKKKLTNIILIRKSTIKMHLFVLELIYLEWFEVLVRLKCQKHTLLPFLYLFGKFIFSKYIQKTRKKR